MDKIFTHKKVNSKKNSEKASLINDINTCTDNPSNNVVNAILNYSKSLVIDKSTFINKVELVLN